MNTFRTVFCKNVTSRTKTGQFAFLIGNFVVKINFHLQLFVLNL